MLARGIVVALAVIAAPAVMTFATPTAAEQTAETTLFAGSWTKKSYTAAGGWRIVEISGKKYVELTDEFRTQNAPDLKIFLSPKASSDLNNRNATEGSLLVSPLSAPRGAQRYEIGADVDLSKYRSIMIHCEAFSKLWAVADLQG